MQMPSSRGVNADQAPEPQKTKKWQYLIAALSLAFTIGLAVLIGFNWDAVHRMAGYGYTGGFIISALGGATVVVPVPMLAVQFALGGILKPLAGPAILGPLYVGVICAAGETLGALSIYMTGIGGSAPFSMPGSGWIKRLSDRLNTLLERRGQLTLFLLSVIMNPLFYPASLAMGASRFGIKRYTAVTLAGKGIKCSLIAYAGYFGLKGIFSLLGLEL